MSGASKCARCNQKVEIDVNVRCPYCGHRILFKERGAAIKELKARCWGSPENPPFFSSGGWGNAPSGAFRDLFFCPEKDMLFFLQISQKCIRLQPDQSVYVNQCPNKEVRQIRGGYPLSEGREGSSGMR